MKKIVNFIVVMTAMIFIGMNSVKAESELFQNVAPDGKITINYRTPKDSGEASSFSSMFLKKKFNISGYISSCNDDYSKCNLNLRVDNKDDKETYESKMVDVVWNEEYSETFKAIAPNNVATIKEMKPTNSKDFATSYFDKFYPNIDGRLSNCNADLTVCDLLIHDRNAKAEDYYIYEIHQVKINWQEEYIYLKQSLLIM